MPGLLGIFSQECQEPGGSPRDHSIKRSRLLPVAVFFLLVSLLCLPATAADNSTPSGDVAIRQAHLAWTALDMDLEMNAAITYCSTLYGSDTSAMSKLLAEFREEEGRISLTASGKEVDALIAGMRNTTGQFRIETGTVMKNGQGKGDDLSRQVSLAKDNNPYLAQKKENYWAVRTAAQLAAFDRWVDDGQQYLDTLKGEGYDVTTAQRALDVFSSRRPDVKAAYAAKSEDAVQSVNAQLLPLSRDFITSLAAVQELVPDSTRFGFFIDQGNRAVGEADRVNIALVPILLDIGDADTILSKTKTDLSQARTLLNTGNLGSTKTPLRLVQKDFTDLAQAYRDIIARTELPPDLTTELNALAIRLDRTADQMGAAL